MPRNRNRGQYGRPPAPPPYSAVPNINQQMSNLSIDAPAPAPPGPKIVVGIDFGTTYTGVSYIFTTGDSAKTLEDVNVIQNWPGTTGGWKTPSRIAYAEENEDELDSNVWGFEVESHLNSYSWMKLLLDEAQKTNFDDPSLFESEGAGCLTKPLTKTAVDICSDYLAGVAEFAFDHIASKIGGIEFLRSCPTDFWFTVPAVWSDRAKADTLRAAQIAARKIKLDCHPDSQVFLIREPEAAAIAALSNLTRGGDEHIIKVGDVVLICDCGGGTVDLTSYEITAIDPKLSFKELLVGTGGKCGSTYIDRKFVRWMEDKFEDAYANLGPDKRGPASETMIKFENHKKKFSNKHRNKVYRVPCHMAKAEESINYEPYDRVVRLRHPDLEEMFDDVVKSFIGLLQSQLDAEKRQNNKSIIKTVLLVGGFGESLYLGDAVRKWCSEHGLRIIVPDQAQSAIVRGAALSGYFEVQPTSRRSRAHYGFSVHQPYDRVRHRPKDQFVWDWDGSLRADNMMEWQLAKGDVVDDKTNIKFELFWLVYDYGNQIFNNTIYCSADDEAPLFVDDYGVQKLATISQDFSAADLTAFQPKLINGSWARRVKCEYTINFGHRRGVLCFSCRINGQEIGNTTIKFDGQNNQDMGNGVAAGGGYSPPCAMQ
ncbi:Heat shock 70 kDa protein 12B [Pseudocercospora fuligena]|uniref:Heat shock 70 kDa protein 12B n=1 Tax=Pseudocercospora fuligena TaxID=685502 RepID=A0A8H6RS51_9PEZI|nr:Heat shock 70 kDa protein 12B [Pseudocercospora fuligena]